MVHHYDFLWRYFPHKELTQVYISSALRKFAISLLGIFIPLYLHVELGYSISDTLFFFVFYSLVFGLASPLAAKFSARYGIKHSIMLSIPIYLCFIGAMHALSSIHLPLILVGGIYGLSQAFYWMGMHLAFFHASSAKSRGKAEAKRHALTVISSALAPLIGGFLIYSSGFGLTFIVAAICLIFSVLVLFLSKDTHEPYHFSLRSVVNKDHWKDSLYFASNGVQAITNGVIWPLFIFVLLGSYLSLGLVGFLLSGVSAVLILLIGRKSDRTDKRKIIRFIAPFEFISWIFRALVGNAPQVYGATIFGSLTGGLRQVPLGALMYNKAKGEVAAYFVAREAYLCLGRILLLTFVLATGSLQGGIYVQSFSSLLALVF